MATYFKRKLEEAGELRETTKVAKCIQGSRWIFLQDKEYPIYTFKTGKDPKKDIIFSEDDFPFIFGVKSHLEENKQKKCWEIKENDVVGFAFTIENG